METKKPATSSETSASSLESLVARLHNGEKIYGYTYRLEIKDQKISYSIENYPEEYGKSLKKLMNKIMKLAISEIGSCFSFLVEDRREAEKIRLYILAKMPFFLDALLNKGYQEFRNLVAESAKIMQFASDASSVKDINGRWVNWRGEEFDASTGCWITPNGQSKSDLVSVALWSVHSSCNGKSEKQIDAL